MFLGFRVFVFIALIPHAIFMKPEECYSHRDPKATPEFSWISWVLVLVLVLVLAVLLLIILLLLLFRSYFCSAPGSPIALACALFDYHDDDDDYHSHATLAPATSTVCR